MGYTMVRLQARLAVSGIGRPAGLNRRRRYKPGPVLQRNRRCEHAAQGPSNCGNSTARRWAAVDAPLNSGQTGGGRQARRAATRTAAEVLAGCKALQAVATFR